jgi:hypothetical protein
MGVPGYQRLARYPLFVVALFLARRRRVGKPKLSIRKIARNSRVGPVEHIRFRVVNVGEAPVTITDIGWRVGFPWRRKYLNENPSVLVDLTGGDATPIEIKTNQPAVFWIPLASRYHRAAARVDPQSWSDFLASEFDGGPARLWAQSVRGWAETADGRRISARLEKSLRVSLARTARLSRKQL